VTRIKESFDDGKNEEKKMEKEKKEVLKAAEES